MTHARGDDPPSESGRRAAAESHAASGPSTTRRTALLALGSTAATSGCVRRVKAILNRNTPAQVSLSIKAPPADDDVRATRIARFLATKLQQVGIDAQVAPLEHEELQRDVLLNHDFDLYVGRLPHIRDPDRLRSLLHSRFDAEPGWQNPFGYADLTVDELLSKQRRQTGDARRETAASIQAAIARDQPFTVVSIPYEVRVVRQDALDDWGEDGLHTALGYLSLRWDESGDRAGGGQVSVNGTATPATATPESEESALRVTITDARMTENLNPLAVEFRGGGFATDLLYDRLARVVDGELRPWLAAGWNWRSTRQSSEVDVTLREGLRWHDGEPLTAEDVAFTYRFLQDTSLGSLATPAPAPRFRGRSSLVDSVEALDERRVRISFDEATSQVAVRALNLPVLPEHIWADRTGQATVAGIDTQGPVTEALVWANGSPVGSGPFAYRSASYRESLTLEPFEDHFLAGEVENLPERYVGLPTFDLLRFVVVPSSQAAVELLGNGEADATASPIHPGHVPEVSRDVSLALSSKASRNLYHVGYNLRRSPLRNPRFRRAVAQLLDKAFLVDDVFRGYARAAASPLAGTQWLAPELEWDGADPELPFPGEGGKLDVARAKRDFTEAGYRYTDDGRLVSG